ncbi:MAG: hypothetical protein Kow0096_11660 [Thiohalomonadaceae bacterium]
MSAASLDMLIHVNTPQARAQLAERLAGCPGVLPTRVDSTKPCLLFVSYDRDQFDIRRVPAIAREMGIEARIVEV